MIDEKKLIEEFEERMQDDNIMCPAIKILDVLKIIEQQPKIGQWIPVEEGFPEEGKVIPVWLSFFEKDIVYTGTGYWDKTHFSYFPKNGKSIIAWKLRERTPLPYEPKGSEENAR